MLILLIIVGLIGATLINKRGWNYYNFTHPDKQLSFNEYLSDNSSVWTKMKSGIPFFVFDSTQNPDQKKLRNAINKHTLGIYTMLDAAFLIRYFLM
jgi:hypothetical protein